MSNVFDGYAAAAAHDLIERFERVPSSALFEPVANLLPRSPVKVADIGAGTGRDAAWFADLGHDVLAVEPVDELRTAGMRLHPSSRIEWLNDHLPELALTQAKGEFGLVVLSAVWQHIDDSARETAIGNLSRITESGGLLVMSLRHGPGASDRPVYCASVDAAIAAAKRHSLHVIERSEAPSIQPRNRSRGVLWTWLALRKIG